eukprot:jgi/Chlat1/4338/Chrsp29S04502
MEEECEALRAELQGGRRGPLSLKEAPGWKPAGEPPRAIPIPAMDGSLFKRSSNRRRSHSDMGSQGGTSPRAFIERMVGDLATRQAKLDEKKRVLRRLEQGGAEAEFSRQRRSEEFLREVLHHRLGLDMEVTDGTIDEVADAHGDALGLSPEQVEKLHRLQGQRKRFYLEKAVRTTEFMHRYEQDKSTRQARKKELHNAILRSAMASAGTPVRTKDEQFADDKRQAVAYFEKMLKWETTENRAADAAARIASISELLQKAVAMSNARAKKDATNGEGNNNGDSNNTNSDFSKNTRGNGFSSGNNAWSAGADADESVRLQLLRAKAREPDIEKDPVKLLARVKKLEMDKLLALTGEKQLNQQFILTMEAKVALREARVEQLTHELTSRLRKHTKIRSAQTQAEFLARLESDLRKRKVKQQAAEEMAKE